METVHLAVGFNMDKCLPENRFCSCLVLMRQIHSLKGQVILFNLLNVKVFDRDYSHVGMNC